jgi:hypothetical protein
MKEIKVNEYVRLARNQGINKIIDIYDKKYELETDIANEWGEFTCILEEYQLKDEIINHSKHLIDLIEIGDIVEDKYNKYEVAFVKDDKIYCNDYNFDDSLITLREQDIKTILTKEQYEANCFKVGGE